MPHLPRVERNIECPAGSKRTLLLDEDEDGLFDSHETLDGAAWTASPFSVRSDRRDLADIDHDPFD